MGYVVRMEEGGEIRYWDPETGKLVRDPGQVYKLLTKAEYGAEIIAKAGLRGCTVVTKEQAVREFAGRA
jgi:hypothetical protein